MGTKTNLALNRPATASSFVMPYAAANAVNGTLVPISRWLCNTLPGWICVDLGANYWINRWVVRHMGTAGWASSDYNMTDFKLQGSTDNNIWRDLDSIAGNLSIITDRTINPVYCRYVRVYVTKGLKCNPQLASVMEFEVYPAPSSPYLTGITLSSGTLSPTPFAGKTTFEYAASVGYDVAYVTLTPIAEDANATIKVNNTVVKNNTASAPISLVVGNNTIIVQVTGSDGSAQQMYTVTVVRQEPDAYLTALILATTGNVSVPYTPTPFDKNTLTYSASVGYDVDKIFVTPSTNISGAGITVNGVGLTGESATVDLAVGSNAILAVVTNSTAIKTYTITVMRTPNLYLAKVDLSYSGRGYTSSGTVSMDHTNLSYTTNTLTKATQVIITPYAEDAAVIINVNGQNVMSGSQSTAISLSNTSNRVTIKVSYSGMSYSRDYVLTIIKS